MSWYSYDDARDQKARMQRTIARKQKTGESFEPLIVPQGSRKLTTTFWGTAWGKHLESHADYEYRLPRGRSYLRQGNVYNLKIEPGVITAQVAGSELYEVCITIRPLQPDAWKTIKEQCSGKVASILDLLAGRLGDGVMLTISDKDRGLFPQPKEIRLSCSCPDYADMCKHAAAVLYGVGVKLDSTPDLFFVLRSVDPSELLAATREETLSASHTTDTALAGEDISALFGIELESESAPEASAVPAATVAKPISVSHRAKRKTAERKPAAKKSRAAK